MMSRLILALALLLAAPFSAEAATRTVTASGTWTGIGPFAGTATLDGALTTADTLVIPSGFTLTIPAATTIDFSTGAGFVTNNGTLVVNGTLAMYNDANGSGTWTVTGTLKSCATSLASCVVAGQTAVNTYAMTTLSSGQRVAGGWRLTYTTNAWDGGAAVGDILEYTDIDGSTSNDSPASALRPFFHIAAVSAGSDYIETTYGVGSSVSDYTLAYNEGNSSIAAGCYVGDTAGAGAGVASIDLTDTDVDGVELDQAWTSATGVLDRSTTISLPTGTLTNNQDHDFEGQWICLAAAGTDANCYLIWDSIDGGAGRDLVRVWPQIKAVDYTAAAKNCTIGWGEPNKTAAGLRGLPLGEFLVFTPARIVGNRPGVSINNTTTGQVNATFAHFGPAAGVAGYGVGINYASGAVVAAAESHTWHTGLSGNSAIGLSDDNHIALGSGSSGAMTLDHVRFTHDFVPRHAASASDTDPDKTSGNHGIANVGTATVTATNFGCFKIGDACVAITSSSPTVNTFDKITCGWIDGQSSACVKAAVAAHSVTIRNLYAANVNSKGRMCNGEGAAPTTSGTRCSVDADCTGATDVCVSATGDVVQLSAGSTATIAGMVVLAGDSDGAHANDLSTTGTTGSAGVSVDGGFILDNRTDNANNATAMTMFAGVGSVKHVSMPFAVNLGNLIVSTYSNNYAQRVRALGTGVGSVLAFNGNLGAAGAPTLRFENNVILDLYDATADDFIDFWDTSIPTGAKFYANNNKVDRSRIAGNGTQWISFNSTGTAFGVAASGELAQITNNAVAGYRELLRCANPTFPASTANLQVSGNAFAPSSGTTVGANTIVEYGCTQGTTYSDPINKANTIVNRYRMMGGSVGGYTGPRGTAGYKQTGWLTSLGIQSVWQESGSGGQRRDSCIGVDCGGMAQ